MKRKSRNKSGPKKTSTSTPVVKSEPIKPVASKSTASTSRRQATRSDPKDIQIDKLRLKSEPLERSEKKRGEKPSDEASPDEATSSSASPPSSSSSLTDSTSPVSASLQAASSSSASNVEGTYLIVELKLIAVDVEASETRMRWRAAETPEDEDRLGVSFFLCLNACATAAHLMTLLAKKLELASAEFDVVLMCHGYEVKPQCPLTFLKNRFFADKDAVKIYYAVVAKKP